MKKNYLSKTAMSANPLALIVAKKSWKNMTTAWLLLLFTVFGFADAFGQVANYTFSESAGTYTSAAGTTVHASGWDDAVSANTIPLGFTFVFNGTNYTTCSIATNGFLTFGGTVAGTTEFTPISSGTGYAGAISAIGYDLISNASTITYTTTGTAPNRTFIAQWNNANRYSSGVIAGDFNFQIRLNETTNVINIVYGTCAPATNTVYSVQVGLRGASNADFNNRSLTNNNIWDGVTTAGGTNNSACRTRSNAYPNSGRTFTWTPPTPPTITSLGAASGCAGSSINITGTNFTGATNVTIGGQPATFVVNNATSITATIAATASGAAGVTVTTPGGTSAAFPFTVNPLPATIGGGAATVCVGGTTPAFTNATAGGTWSTSNANATINASGVLTGVTAGTVRVRYTLPTGCFVETTNITVQQPPSAIAGGAATVCVGSTTPAFTNAVAGGTWTVVNGTGTATITSPGGVLTGGTAGDVTVNYTIGTCPPATFNVTVNPAPAAIGGGAATVCTGVSTPAFTNATPGGTWSVIPAGGTASITAGGILTGTTAGNVRVRYTLPSGCFVQTALITIQQTPGAIAGGAATVCVGSSTPAFTNPNGGGTWSVVNGTGAATITSPGGVLTGTSAGTVTVNYTIGTCTPATYNVTVNPAPAAIAGGATTVCVGGTTPAFTNATAGGTWSTSNANATINASGVLTGVTSGTVRVIYTLPTGCFVQTALITINSLPTTVATPTPTNGATGVCYSGTGAVTSISWGAVAGATSYDVYFGAGSVPVTVTANVATNTYNTGALAANTTYYWRIVAKNACGDASSSATFIFTTATATCVCIPTATTDNGTGITNVIFNTINNSTSGTSAYSDFTSISTSLMGSLTH